MEENENIFLKKKSLRINNVFTELNLWHFGARHYGAAQ